MITLFTGAPGAGKTAALVDLLSRELADRPLYVHGLNGLTLPHTVVDAARWHDELPDGAVLVVDEAQQVWRPRGPSVKPGLDVTSMETHRHRGIDIFMTTQKPTLIDSNIRGLVGRHVHIRDTGWMGRWWYEWPEVSENLAWKTCPVRKRYTLPKKAFHLYKSASMHIKAPRFGSKALYLLGAALVLVLILSFFAYRSISDKTKAKPPHLADAHVSASLPPRSSLAHSAVAFLPRDPVDPGSAPAFDALRKVVAVPRIVGGYCVEDTCICYTQQSTRVSISDDQCRSWLTNTPFDPYRADEAKKEPPMTPNEGGRQGGVVLDEAGVSGA